MNFYNFSIKRPVTVVMGMFMVLVVGLLSLQRMPLDLMPKITFPNLMVMVTYEGAGPEEIEERVAKPLESAIKATANIKNVKVNAQEGSCLINAEFNWGTDLDSASSDLREKISMVRKYLPDDVEDPIVLRINLQDMPVLFMHLDDPTKRRNLADLADICRDQISPQLERLPGVAQAPVMGGLTREIQINLDREKMQQYQISFTDVINAIRYRNLDQMAGNIDVASMRFRVRGKSEFASLEEIERIVIGNGMTPSQRQQLAMMAILPEKDLLAGQGAISPIRLSDVAEVRDDYKERMGLIRVVRHGEITEGVGMAAMKETDANMVEVADIVKSNLDKIRQTLPQGTRLEISFDLSEFVTDTVSALTTSAYEGAFLAAVIIFIFLMRFRPSFIILLSIPLSLLFTFMCMYFSGYTLNIMTMGGMVISVGKLVDDSIVVLENIFRHLAMGEHPFLAAENGFREVMIAVLSATLVAVIIFLPVAFTQGLSAQMFRTFAGTVFFALMASLFVAFTVVPMLSSRLLSAEVADEKRKRIHVFLAMQKYYVRLLSWSLDNWGKVLVLTVVIAGLTVIMAAQMSIEFMPQMVGGIYQADVKLPAGAVLQETDRAVRQVTDTMIKRVKDYKTLFLVVGASGDAQRAAFTGGEQGINHAMMMVMMKKKAEGRTTTDQELSDIWDRFAKQKPNAEVSFMSAGSIKMTSDKPILVKVFGDDFTVLKRISEQVAARVKKVEGCRDVTTSMQEGVPEYVFHLDRDKISSYGLVDAQVLMEAKAAVGGQLSSIYREAGKEYDITVRLNKDQRLQLDDVGEITLNSPFGFHFPLREVADFEYTEGPLKIERENSKRIVKVGANKTDRPLGDIITDIQGQLKTVPLPEGYSLEFGGDYQDMMDAFKDLLFMFTAALLLVYMILASLYESLVHPITMLVAVPLAFTGAIAGLFITNISFGVTAAIGMIMLVGIVANNSIVLMDFVISYHRGGMDRREALLEAGSNRLRPILMTALATLFGVLPIALGQAEGMELQQPLGIVVVGGLISSTILTLVIIPVFYQLFDDFALDMKRIFRRKKKVVAN